MARPQTMLPTNFCGVSTPMCGFYLHKPRLGVLTPPSMLILALIPKKVAP